MAWGNTTVWKKKKDIYLSSSKVKFMKQFVNGGYKIKEMYLV